MARVLLVNPPSPERLGSPLLGQQYVAAALLAHGCEVKVIDAAARFYPSSGADRASDADLDAIVAEAEAFRPDMVGVALFTRWVWHAYRLVDKMRARFPLLVAGGAHATACPDEPLARGFDFVLTGEAEESIVGLVDWLERGKALESIAGLRWLGPDGAPRTTGPSRFVEDLDRLAPPMLAQRLFDPRWYDPSGRQVVPGGLLTSRGCPAKCTFCANYVTGRGFRHRSTDLVIRELGEYHAQTGATFFPFWDDALTANPKRLLAMCAGFEEELDFPLQWSAITRATMVTPEILRAMKRAGCVHVNFGVESGDDDVLRAIKKGVLTRHVVRALEWAKAEGLMTACNFMLGFPEDTPATLERTMRFMESIAPLTDTFSTLGVVVPFPGTPLYDDHVDRYDFRAWWLREDHARFDAPPPVTDHDRFYRHYIDDANLELDFFRYDAATKDMIRACLRFKAEHNLRKMGLLKDPVHAPHAEHAAE